MCFRTRSREGGNWTDLSRGEGARAIEFSDDKHQDQGLNSVVTGRWRGDLAGQEALEGVKTVEDDAQVLRAAGWMTSLIEL